VDMGAHIERVRVYVQWLRSIPMPLLQRRSEEVSANRPERGCTRSEISRRVVSRLEGIAGKDLCRRQEIIHKRSGTRE